MWIWAPDLGSHCTGVLRHANSISVAAETVLGCYIFCKLHLLVSGIRKEVRVVSPFGRHIVWLVLSQINTCRVMLSHSNPGKVYTLA